MLELGCHPHHTKQADDIYMPISPMSVDSSGRKSTFGADPHRAQVHGTLQLGRKWSSVFYMGLRNKDKESQV